MIRIKKLFVLFIVFVISILFNNTINASDAINVMIQNNEGLKKCIMENAHITNENESLSDALYNISEDYGKTLRCRKTDTTDYTINSLDDIWLLQFIVDENGGHYDYMIHNLYFEGHNISTLPTSWTPNPMTFGAIGSIDLSYLSNIKRIEINNNQSSNITNMSESCKISSLDTLSLGHNNFTNFPDISSCTNLDKLFLNNNQISNIPNISSLSILSDLDLSNNRLTALEDNLVLPSLTRLSLGSNNISSYSTNIDQLINLQSLNLANNNTSRFPTELYTLASVSLDLELDLGYNNITEIPSNIYTFTALTDLRLEYNEINSIPDSIMSSNIVNLYINNNKINTLSEVLFNYLSNDISCKAIVEVFSFEKEEAYVNNNYIIGGFDILKLGLDYDFSLTRDGNSVVNRMLNRAANGFTINNGILTIDKAHLINEGNYVLTIYVNNPTKDVLATSEYTFSFKLNNKQTSNLDESSKIENNGNLVKTGTDTLFILTIPSMIILFSIGLIVYYNKKTKLN